MLFFPRTIFPIQYRWIITYTLAFTELISWGILYYTFTVFLPPMEQSLGWSRSFLSIGFALANVGRAVFTFPTGVLLDRFGARLIMSIGSLLGSASVWLWSVAESPFLYLLAWTGIGISTAGVLYDPAFATVNAWFTEGKAKALAIVTLAGGLSSTLFLPVSNWMIHNMGWRDAAQTLALILFVTTFPLHLLVLKNPPQENDLHTKRKTVIEPTEYDVTAQQAMRTASFWWLILAGSLLFFVATIAKVHLVPYLIDEGFHEGWAAAVVGGIGVSQVIGRLLYAPFDNRFPRPIVGAGVFAFGIIALLFLLLIPGKWGAILCVSFFGVASGCVTLIRPLLIGDLFGRVHFGKISSILAIFLTLAGTISPYLASVIQEATGSYDLVWWGCILLTILAIFAILQIQPSRKT